MIKISSLIRSIGDKIAEKKIDDEAFEVMRKHPNPSDKIVHDHAKKNDYEPSVFEEAIYKLATKYVKFISGGLAASKGFSKKDADPKQLKMGIQVESKEHTGGDKEIGEKIALDHLAEISNYYDRLEEMEKGSKS